MQFCCFKKFEKIDLSNLKGCFDAFAKVQKTRPSLLPCGKGQPLKKAASRAGKARREGRVWPTKKPRTKARLV